ncbi:MAG TPA: SAF domain-containing protein [Jatrophihabitantaceae bacterium]|nr:SAF domain-containing protein [Jatrophihabitantaceae bacterium]
MFATLRARLPRIGRVPRLLVAGTCLLLALSSALGTKKHRHALATGTRTVVAARDLPAGHVLTRVDLRIARLPTALRPATARGDPAAWVRRRLAGPIHAREVITATRLVSSDLAAGLRGGLVAAAIELDDPRAVDLVRAGNRVDVLEAPRAPDVLDATPVATSRVTTAARDVQVLAVLPARDGGPAELIVAIEPAAVLRITRDRTNHVFTAVVVPP